MRKYLWILFALWANILFGQTYGDYYQSARGLKDDALKTALYNIIKGHTEYYYTSSSTDVWDILKETDKDPNNPDNVIFLYSGQSILAGAAGDEYRSGSGWSREHVWAKSRGDFGTDKGAGTDVHHLRPEDISVNSTRSNRSFDNCVTCKEVWDNGEFTGSYTDENLWTFEPRDEVKGDVARMIFYMAVRYEGENGEPDLELTENLPDKYDDSPYHGRLSTLLSWNRIDPVSDWERNRNEIIYTQFQHNRNPFIDIPELAEYIWGNDIGAIWSTTGTEEAEKATLLIVPNPSSGTFKIQNLNTGELRIFTVEGKCVFEKNITTKQSELKLVLPKGIYFLQLNSKKEIQNLKIVIQ